MSFEADFDSFLQGHDELTSEVNKYNAIPIARKGRDDPLYVAQMLQLDLNKAPEYADTMGDYAVETLDNLVPLSMLENRLAISTLRLCALDNTTCQSLSMSGNMLVSGVYQKFIFDTFDDDLSIALQVTDPYFIDPEMYITPGSLLQINSLAIPVGGIEQWRLLPRIDEN